MANFYLYGVVKGDEGIDLGLKGIGGAAVFTVAVHGLAAVVQECQAPFSSEDPKLVSEWVLAHQAVVDFAWEKFETVVPFSFGMMIVAKEGKTARENLLEWMGKERAALTRKLVRLKGKEEYGVQISWDPTIVASRITKHDEEIQKLEGEIRSKNVGTAYLLKQKLEMLLRRRLETAADIYFKEFYQKIKGCSEEVRIEKTRKPDSGKPDSGGDEGASPRPAPPMLANLSCLVPKGDVPRLGNELEKIGGIEGFSVRFTGPWPPYSFVNP